MVAWEIHLGHHLCDHGRFEARVLGGMDGHVGITFSGDNRSTSAGIVAINTKVTPTECASFVI